MDIADEPQLVYTTLPSLDEAERMARSLIERRLAAGVNILPGVTSIYRWQGSIERVQEVLMMIKTTGEYVDRLMEAIAETHPYDVPALLAMPITKAGPLYGAWIAAQTAPDDDEDDEE